MMINHDQSVAINHNTNWPYIRDHPCRILIIGGSGSGKNSALLTLIKSQRPDIPKLIYMSKIHTVTELFLIGRKLNVSLFFIAKSYSKVPKIIKLNATNYIVMKIPNERELQEIASNHSSDFKEFIKLYKDFAKEPYWFLVNDTTLSSDNPLRFKKNSSWKSWLKNEKFTEKIKTIENKIVQNNVQYDLYKQTATISALSLQNVTKYEFLTGKMY